MSSRRMLIARSSRARMEARATLLMRLSLVLIAFLLNGDFHPNLIPAGHDPNSQQTMGLAFWLVILACSFFLTPILEIEWSAGLYVVFAFFGLAMASAFWAEEVQTSLLKSVAQLIILIGAWRLVLTFPWPEITNCIQLGLFAICALSAATAIFVPSIGVLSDYMHGGQWSGLFSSKQTLGICAAMLLFFSGFQLMHAARFVPYGWISVAVSVLCLLASGSRGGGVVAVTAIAAIYLMSKWRSFARALAFAPFVMGVAATGVIAYLLYTQNRYLVVFGSNLDITERTFIWHHALSFLGRFPWFGAGVNGFWTQDVVRDLFTERYKWFLDNYHSGYIAIIMETGVVGYALFLLANLSFAFRVEELSRSPRVSMSEISFCVGYLFLVFVIDFTETYFLRSTNIAATQIIMVMAFVFARPTTASQASAPDATICLGAQRRRQATRAGALGGMG
ncbi:MAG: O-antigen ligase family protein [Hyphomicrobiales bacterium]|nr:MAG: O-antigen ligase family protein [Hyphomicrobiales bacterium]